MDIRKYSCGKTLEQVFMNFRVNQKDREKISNFLLMEGYTIQGICYAASRAEEKLYKFVDDPRFASVFINEVKKYAYKKNDPRWELKNK